MPSRPKRPCKHPGCSALVGAGYCDKHKQLNHYDRYRGSAAERGYDARWRKARAIYLKLNPLCVECKRQSEIEPATVVDHIQPHKGDKFLFWDQRNWQALCKRCHDKKTATEDGGWGNKQGG